MSSQQQIVFRLKDGIQTADSLAHTALRWYMGKSGLTRPECTFFYRDTSIRSFTEEEFRPAPPAEAWRNMVAFVSVAGMDAEDTRRAVLSYASGSYLLILHFPGSGRPDAQARQLAARLKAAVPGLPEPTGA